MHGPDVIPAYPANSRGGHRVSARAVAWAWDQKVFPSATVLLQCLADEADDQGNCGVNDVSTLARKCGVSERTIHRDLEFLEFTTRICIDRRWSPEGLQLRSEYVLNLNRPADTQYTFRRPKGLRRRAKRSTDNLAVRGGQSTVRSVTLAGQSPSSAVVSGHGTAMLSGSESSGCDNQSMHSVNRADKKQHTKAVVVVSKNTTTTVSSAELDQLIPRLQDEMCLDAAQAQKVFSDHLPSHLIKVIQYVSKRYRDGKVRGNIAPYFLKTVEQASPESLGLKQSTLDVASPEPAPNEAQIAAEVAASAERDEARKVMQEAEAAWNALDAREQETLRATFMSEMAQTNPVIYDLLRHQTDLTKGFGYRFLLDWFPSRPKDQINVVEGQCGDG